MFPVRFPLPKFSQVWPGFAIMSFALRDIVPPPSIETIIILKFFKYFKVKTKKEKDWEYIKTFFLAFLILKRWLLSDSHSMSWKKNYNQIFFGSITYFAPIILLVINVFSLKFISQFLLFLKSSYYNEKGKGIPRH